MYIIKCAQRKTEWSFVDSESQYLFSVYSIWCNNLILYKIFCHLNNKMIIVFYKFTIIILFMDNLLNWFFIVGDSADMSGKETWILSVLVILYSSNC